MSGKIAILGTGGVGTTLAKALIAKGFSVALGTRDVNATKAKDEFKKTAPQEAQVLTFADACKFADKFILLTVHGNSEVDLVKSLPATQGTKILVDIGNPLNFVNGIPELSITGKDSLGERVAKAAPAGYTVVKALNHCSAAVMVNPTGFHQDPTSFICGADEGAKKEVTHLLSTLGWKTILDLGGIETSRELEATCILWCKAAPKINPPGSGWGTTFSLASRK